MRILSLTTAAAVAFLITMPTTSARAELPPWIELRPGDVVVRNIPGARAAAAAVGRSLSVSLFEDRVTLTAAEVPAGRTGPVTDHLLLEFAGGRRERVPVVISPTLVSEVMPLLTPVPHATLNWAGLHMVLRGYYEDEHQKALIAQILKMYPQIVDQTSSSMAGNDEMIEIDVIIVLQTDRTQNSYGVDVFELIRLQYDFLLRKEYSPFVVLGSTIGKIDGVQRRHQLSLAVDYTMDIANALDASSRVVARPHLVATNGQPAEFHSGGEVAVRVSGLNSGDLKYTPFGIILNVTPTQLKDGRVRLKIDAQRISVLGALLNTGVNEDIRFDKTVVKSEAILDFNETLVLSGLYQRERTQRESGVPILRDIPILDLFSSDSSEIEEVTTLVMFLTPRKPGIVNEANQAAFDEFMARRARYVEALSSGDPARIRAFQEAFPGWYKPQSNRWATHLYMSVNSEVYRSLRGEDLRTEALDEDLMRIDTAR